MSKEEKQLVKLKVYKKMNKDINDYKVMLFNMTMNISDYKVMLFNMTMNISLQSDVIQYDNEYQ